MHRGAKFPGMNVKVNIYISSTHRTHRIKVTPGYDALVKYYINHSKSYNTVRQLLNESATIIDNLDKFEHDNNMLYRIKQAIEACS
jgi:hypothetical protein